MRQPVFYGILRHPIRRALCALLWIAAFSISLSGRPAAANTLDVPSDYPTIQSAVNAAASGDKIQVAAGTYTENVSLPGNGNATNLAIIGAGQGVTLIDGAVGGPALAISAGTTTTIQGVTIQHCTSPYGAIYNLGTLTALDVSVVGNTNTTNSGGGIDNYVGAILTMTGCTISDNSCTGGGNGGGIAISVSTATLMDCTLSGNAALHGEGGGIVNTGTLSCANCIFLANFAGGTGGGGGGGIAQNNEGRMALTDCIIAGNSSAYYFGGGIHDHGGAAALTNCTLSGNSAPDASGGGVAVTLDRTPGALTLLNCILWGDSAAAYGEVYVGSSTATVAYTDDLGGLPAGATDSGNNLAVDPRFVRNPFTNGPGDVGDLHLQSGSPCIDVGRNAVVISPPFLMNATNSFIIDLDGNPRTVGGTVDMGAYEYQFAIYNLTSSGITSSSAAISWTTSAPATSTVQYGVTSNYGSTATSATLVSDHNLGLTGLLPATLYHYRAFSTGANGSPALSGDMTFVTSPSSGGAGGGSGGTGGNSGSGTNGFLNYSSVTRTRRGYTLSLTVTNNAPSQFGVTLYDGYMTAISLGPANTTTPLPLSLPVLFPGETSGPYTLSFPLTAGASGSSATLAVSGTQEGLLGDIIPFYSTISVRLP